MTVSPQAPTTIDDGGPAFPMPASETSIGGHYEQIGMSLRDYFAGQAIASIPLRSWDHLGPDDGDRIKAWARCACLVADALLTARKGGGRP